MVTPPRPSGNVDADELGRREFSRSRKGFDSNEVRAHLLTMAGEIKRLQAAEAALESTVSSLQREVEARSELDETQMTQMLGEETARVLEAARAAAGEVRAKADAEAGRVVNEANEQAVRTTTEADELRLAASREADELVGEARRRVEEMTEDARRGAEELRAEAEADAAAARERSDDAAREKLAEADAEAERLRAAATSTREEADSYSERVRREAEQHATTARNDADRHAEEVRTEADIAAARIRDEAVAAAEQRADEAAEAAEQEVEVAHEQGRRMVEEARDARERMLRDLAERRRTARQQLEALRAGRERLLEAFGSARTAFDEATDELTDALPEARAAADAAAREVDDDMAAAVAELDRTIAGGDDESPAGSEPGQSSPEVLDQTGRRNGVGAAPAGKPTDDADDADDEKGSSTGASTAPHPTDEVSAPTTAGGGPSAAPTPSHLRLVASGPARPVPVTLDDDDLDDDDLDDDDLDDDESEADFDADGELDPDDDGGSVEAIFARLRAERPEDVAGDAGDDTEPDRAGTGAAATDPVRLPEGQVIDLSASGSPEPAADDQVDGDDADVDDADAEPTLLDRRDEVLDGVERKVGRRLKRALSDQENAILDRLQRSKKQTVTREVLDDAADASTALWNALEEELREAVASGARFLDDPAHGRDVDAGAEVASLRELVDERVAAPLRDRLERTIDDAADPGDAPDRLRAVYREWKGEKVVDLAGDLVTLAFNRGILASATSGTAHCWIVDHGGLACPDAEDNHLAGAVVAGDDFPTGHSLPPAHPGCRCLLAPEPR